ncbi:MAG: methyltransferase domain-containing protein [Rubripirellula sp.]
MQSRSPSNMMFQRDQQPEMMDDPELPREEHLHALAGLRNLNIVSGVSAATYSHLRRYSKAQSGRPLNVLDVASGGGDIPIAWAKRAKRDGWDLQLTLIDLRSVAVEQQQQSAKAAGVNLLSLQQDCLNGPLPTGFDVVTCTLFMHHLDDSQAFRLLQSMQQATDQALLVCDLERSRFNLGVVSMASHLVTRSKVVHNDAALSVRAAYTIAEFEKLAKSALARPVRVQRAFPCRFIASYDELAVPEIVPAFA